MIIVAGLLMLALLGAVLSSVGGDHPGAASIWDVDNQPPAHEISRQALPASFGRT
jgi:hypothetical protein